MPGVARRDKPLKASGAFSDLDGVTLSGLTSGDILVHNGSDFVNTKALVGTYTLTGTLTATDLTTTDDVTVGDDLIVTGLATIGETLSVTGNATLQGAATVGTTLGVTGAATLSSTLSVAGLLSGAGFSFSGNGTITGTLGVTGASTLGALSATTLSTSGLATLASLSVTGTSTLNDQLTVNAAITAGAISGSSLGATGSVTGSSFEGPNFSITRSAPDVTWQNTVNDDTILFRGAYDVGAGQVLTDILKLTPNVGGTLTGTMTLTDELNFSHATAAVIDLTTDSTTLSITGLSSGSVARTLAVFDPDGTTQLWHNGALALETDTLGVNILPSDFGTNPGLFLQDSSKVDRTRFYATSTVSGWRAEVDSMHLKMEAYDAGTVLREMILCDPDVGVLIRDDGGNIIVETRNNALGFYGTSPAAQSAAYSRTATVVESRTLAASASATATNNNNVLAALIADLQAVGIIG